MNQTTRRVLVVVLGALVTALLTLLVSLPAKGHTREQLDSWREDWIDRARSGFSLDLRDEFLDMMERHPWYWTPPPPPQARAERNLASSASSTAPSRGMGSNVEQWRGLVSAYFPGSQVNMALCIIRYESGGNPDAKNPRSSARGLFQVLASLWAPYYGVSYEDLYNPEINTRIAADIWANYGWGAWSALRRC